MAVALCPELVDKLPDLIELSDVKDNLGSKMSDGQQRTAVVRALMTRPKVALGTFVTVVHVAGFSRRLTESSR